jgi:hypothetical protein
MMALMIGSDARLPRLGLWLLLLGCLFVCAPTTYPGYWQSQEGFVPVFNAAHSGNVASLATTPDLWRGIGRGAFLLAQPLMVLGATATIVLGIVLRTTTATTTDWEIPLSVLALITATFLSAGYTQLKRNHVSIEVLEHVLPARANRWRFIIGDLLSLATRHGRASASMPMRVRSSSTAAWGARRRGSVSSSRKGRAVSRPRAPT